MDSRVRGADGGFVPEVVLESWLRSGEAVRAGAVLSSRDGRRFMLRDALRVLGRRNGEVDPYGLNGRADGIREFLRQGALIGPDGLRLGAAVYDVEYGVLAIPYASADESGANPKLA